MPIAFEIRHATRGRVRVRLPAIGSVANFGAAVRELLGRVPGVISARVNEVCRSVVIEFDPDRSATLEQLTAALAASTPEAVVAMAGLTDACDASPDIPTDTSPADGTVFPVATAAALLALIPGAAPLAWLGIAWAGAPIVRRAWDAMSDKHRLNIDVLDTCAIAFAAVQASAVTGALLTWLVALGDRIRQFTADQSERAVGDIIGFENRLAHVVRGGTVRTVPVRDLRVGDTVVVYAGSTVPVDGTVARGQGTVNQQTVTGESAPVDRAVGDAVFAGTLVVDGELYVSAVRVGRDTVAGQLVTLVEQVPHTDTRIQNYAERFADDLVAPSLATAGGFYAVSGDLNRLTSMLIVDAGTGIRVAAPTSVLATITRAARVGILIRGGRQLERLSGVDTIVFDKTGTLTTGALEVVTINQSAEVPDDDLLTMAAAAELRCPHPVAEAVVRAAAARGLAIPDRSESHYRVGLGVEAEVAGSIVHVGSERFLRRRGIDTAPAARLVADAQERACSSLLVARGGHLIGTIEYRDALRPESAPVFRTLRNRGLRCLMLTGDNQAIAHAVARELGIDEVYADVLPSNKAEIVRALQKQGATVAMVGDGINDSAALAYADVGIAVHGGADLALASAGIVLVDGSLWNVVTAMDLATNAMALIHQNWTLTAAANILAFVLAIPAGAVAPAAIAALSNGSAIVAAMNAARPLWG